MPLPAHVTPATTDPKSRSGTPCPTAASSPQEPYAAPQRARGEQITSRSGRDDDSALNFEHAPPNPLQSSDHPDMPITCPTQQASTNASPRRRRTETSPPGSRRRPHSSNNQLPALQRRATPVKFDRRRSKRQPPAQSKPPSAAGSLTTPRCSSTVQFALDIIGH